MDAMGPRPRNSGEDGSLRGFLERALDESGSELPEFVRLQILLALELGPARPEVLERLRYVRDRGRAQIADAIAPDLPGEDRSRTLALADDLAFLTMCFAQGTLLGRMAEPEAIPAERVAEEIDVAIRAVADHRLKKIRLAEAAAPAEADAKP